MIQGSKIWFLRVFNPMESEKKGFETRKKLRILSPKLGQMAILGFWGPFGGPLWGIQGPNTPLVACYCVHFIILGACKSLRTIPDVTWTRKKGLKKNSRVPGAGRAENGEVLLAQNVTEF